MFGRHRTHPTFALPVAARRIQVVFGGLELRLESHWDYAAGLEHLPRWGVDGESGRDRFTGFRHGGEVTWTLPQLVVAD